MQQMYNMLKEILIVLSICLVLIKSECPSAESIKPCKCFPKSMNIQCSGSDVNLLKLDTLGKNEFNILYIHDTNITSINSLGDLTWNKIIIQNNKHLQYIQENAFKKGPKQTLWISNNSNLDHNSLFKEIRHIEITETIELDGNGIKSIPTYGFSGSSKLRNFYIRNNKISKIDKNTFIGLKELINVALDNNLITEIEDFGLNLTADNGKERKVTISLNDNKLNDKSLTSKAFPDVMGISLDINFAYNDFTTINEEVFGTLVRNRRNYLDFENNDLICNCDMLWILKQTNETYVKNIGCSQQKKSLYDLKESDLNCQTSPSTITSITTSTSSKSTSEESLTTDSTAIPTITPKFIRSTTKDVLQTTTSKSVTIKTKKTKKPITEEPQTTTPVPPRCPSLRDIAPCICDQNSLLIQCFGPDLDNFNISKIGPKIQSFSSKFDSIRISSTSMTEIPKFVLTGANFNKILIEENENLQRIDSEVFAKSKTEAFMVRGNLKLSDSDVFDLAKNLDSIEIILSSNALKEIPEMAFVDEENPFNKRLTRISLDHNNIEIICSNAFTGLQNLSFLSLDHNMITTIEDYGLKFSTVSSHLKILLNNNRIDSLGLTSRSIDIPEKITLNLNLAENQLTLLSKSVFNNILNRAKSELNLRANKFICDCDTKWLLNETFRKNALNVFCHNKQKYFFELTEEDLFCLECPSSQNINPCTCNQTSLTIQCNGQLINDELIESIGPKIKSSPLLEYKWLVISDTNVKSLQKPIFSNANFSYIIIEDNRNLEVIDPKMLSKSQTESLKVMNNRNLSDSNVYNLAKALDPILVNFSNNAIEEIPEFAFIENEKSVNKRLSVISLDHNKIDRIPSNAFIGLANLTYLSLSHNLITAVDDFGLKLTTMSYNFIKVFLNSNNLNSDSFASKSIDISENITLTLNFENNKITTLNENLFKPIFVKYNNEILLKGNKFLCDCHMKWLLIEPQAKNNYHVECNNKDDKFIFELSMKDLTCSSKFI